MTQNVTNEKSNEIYLSIFINLLNWKQSFEKVFSSKASEYTAGIFLTMETRNCTTENIFFFFAKFLMIRIKGKTIHAKPIFEFFLCLVFVNTAPKRFFSIIEFVSIFWIFFDSLDINHSQNIWD